MNSILGKRNFEDVSTEDFCEYKSFDELFSDQNFKFLNEESNIDFPNVDEMEEKILVLTQELENVKKKSEIYKENMKYSLLISRQVLINHVELELKLKEKNNEILNLRSQYDQDLDELNHELQVKCLSLDLLRDQHEKAIFDLSECLKKIKIYEKLIFRTKAFKLMIAKILNKRSEYEEYFENNLQISNLEIEYQTLTRLKKIRALNNVCLDLEIERTKLQISNRQFIKLQKLQQLNICSEFESCTSFKTYIQALEANCCKK